MARTSAYKEYSRLERIMTVEDSFNRGMSYVNTPLDIGNAKILVNYDLKNQGTSLTPRGGLVQSEDMELPVWEVAEGFEGVHPILHHVGSSVMNVVYDLNNEDNFIFKYFMLAKAVEHPITKQLAYDLDNAVVYTNCDDPRYGTKFAWSVYTNIGKSEIPKTNYIALSEPTQSTMHSEVLQNNMYCGKGVFASIAANTYIPVYNTVTKENKLVRVQFDYERRDEGVPDISVKFIEVTPKEISASQVINSGYNMLKPDPYTFANTQTTSGALELKGVTLRDEAGKIMFSADAGEVVTFVLHYTYPSGATDYVAEWLIKDTTTSAAPTVLVTAESLEKTHTPGSDVTYTGVVPYKQYTVIVRMYSKADIVAYNADTSKDKPEPLKVITVSAYSGALSNSANLTPSVYNVPNCAGMCAWQQRLVVWGVVGAKSTLFVSQPNMPEYMPFPNNVEVFTEDIVRCVPYLDNLLVFTKTRLYMLTIAVTAEGTSYNTKCIQERLIVSEEDAATVCVVKNMIFFKSENYFYMMVPNSKVGAGELQLAPISRPIENLLDNLNKGVLDILNTMYNPETVFEGNSSYEIHLVDYNNYLDGTTIRNVYKYEVIVDNPFRTVDKRYIDFSLNYDTALRSWTSYIYEATRFRLAAFEHTVTGNTLFLRLAPSTVESEDANFPQIVKFAVGSPEDNMPGTSFNKQDDRKFINYQLIDTGYRNHHSAYKKRFREIQFTINNTSQDELNFFTSFVVDDDVRRALFTYEVVHIIDPESPDYGLIYVERVPVESLDVAGAIKLDSGDGLTLDFSKFKTITLAKVRYHVSGKGYVGRIQILCKNQIPYELLGTHWVYRKMNAR